MNLPAPDGRNLLSSGWPWTEETDPGIYTGRQDWPKISIVTPSYNQGAYLEETIRSVLCQNYPNLEYVIIDGGSSDQSVEIIKKYSPWLHGWVSEKDAGQSDALNKGFRQAGGELVAWINSDDYYEKDALFKVADEYMKTGCTLFCGTCQMIDQQGKHMQTLYTPIIVYATLIRYWIPHFCPPQPSIFFKRIILEEFGEFNTGLSYAMDFDLWLKASKKHTFRVVSDNLSYYRVHEFSKSGSAGGMGKFIPEWKMLINQSLEEESFFTKWNYRMHENLFLLKTPIRRLFSRQELKYRLSPWIALMKSKKPKSM